MKLLLDFKILFVYESLQTICFKFLVLSTDIAERAIILRCSNEKKFSFEHSLDKRYYFNNNSVYYIIIIIIYEVKNETYFQENW